MWIGSWVPSAGCLLASSSRAPFFGGIENEFSVRSTSFLARSPTEELSRGSPLQFSFKYPQSHPGRSGGSLQGRASSVSHWRGQKHFEFDLALTIVPGFGVPVEPMGRVCLAPVHLALQ